MKSITVSLILVVIALFLFAGLYVSFKKMIKPLPFACTTDAKRCPDGTYVKRAGLNCEFTSCFLGATSTTSPTVSSSTINQ